MRAFKELVRMHKPDLVALFEPRISGSSADEVCKKTGFANWIRVEASGFSGGIWVLWNNSINIHIVRTDPQFVLMQVHDRVGDPFWLAAVYASPNRTLRRILWKEMNAPLLGVMGPWAVVGDFNATMFMDERSSINGQSKEGCREFHDWFQREGLVDMGFTGQMFTWSRGNEASTFNGARLDRGLCNIDWLEKFKGFEVCILPRTSSDHSPLLLRTDQSQPRQNIEHGFKFKASWLGQQDFLSLIRARWNMGELMHNNTSNIAKDLIDWNNRVLGGTTRKKKQLIARIEGIQKKLSVSPPGGLIKLEAKHRKDLDDILHQEELDWFQRSREEWIVSGDRNTKYYHAVTMTRKNANKVTSLKNDEGILIQDQDQIASMVRSYYVKLFTDTEGFILDRSIDNGFPMISEGCWRKFYHPVSYEEIKNDLFSMAPFKAPGPNGLHASFYQKTWDIVGKSIIDNTTNFWSTGIMPEYLNDTLVTLIPKVNNPELVSQFRPISLCNVAYKVITKTMTNKLKSILPVVIGEHQSSFVPGRQISDNILVYQEVLHSMKLKKGHRGIMIWKIDLEKAYDRLSWDFIRNTLFCLGLNNDWVRNIMACVESPGMSIIWNGKQTD